MDKSERLAVLAQMIMSLETVQQAGRKLGLPQTLRAISRALNLTRTAYRIEADD